MIKYFIISTLIAYSITFKLQADSVYTTFSVYYPQSKIADAQKIYLRGDNCNMTWNKGVQMKKTSTSQWKAVLLCEKDVTIKVKAILNDSIWMFGNNKIFIGGQIKVVIYPSFNPKMNPIIDISNVTSKILGNTRKASIYYPPSFNDNTLKQYQVLIMHDGQNLYDNSKAAFGTAWLIQNTINTLTSQGKMREIIVVGLWNTNDRNNQYTYSVDPGYKFGGKGEKYLDFIQKQVIPLIQNSWLKGRVLGKYGIGGSSLGGLISCYAGYTRSTIFQKSICMSSSFWWNNEDFNFQILTTNKFYNNIQFYVDSGDSGPSQDSKNQTIAVYNHFSKIGYKQSQTLFYYLDKGGQHSQSYWGRRFYIPMQYLYP